MTGNTDPQSFLNEYVAKRVAPGVSDNVVDLPDFTVDQRFVPLETPPYRV